MSAITQAYIQQLGGGNLEPEHEDVLLVLEGRGIPCELFTRKQMDRRQLSPLSQTTLVVGDHGAMKRAFRFLGVPEDRLPADTYPPSVRHFLKRRVWRSDAGQVRGGVPTSVFVKPVDDTKKFAGFVVHPSSDMAVLQNVSKRTKVYCSEVVNWISEYRVFVNQSKIVGIRHYSGDASVQLDRSVVDHFVLEFQRARETVCAFAADFGVMENGDTALVEWNDGYALGSYGLAAETYTDLLVTRWEEITREREHSPLNIR